MGGREGRASGRLPAGAPNAPLHHSPESRPHADGTSEQMRRTAISHIEGHFPGVLCWWGGHTHRWWAYVPTSLGGCLLEATTPNALVSQIAQRTGERA